MKKGLSVVIGIAVLALAVVAWQPLTVTAKGCCGEKAGSTNEVVKAEGTNGCGNAKGGGCKHEGAAEGKECGGCKK